MIYGYNTISGNTIGLPNASDNLEINGLNTISGNISNVYHSKAIVIGGNNTISGDTSGFTSPTSVVNIGGSNTISGDVVRLPSSLREFTVLGNSTISGNTLDIPSGITFMSLTGSSISGNVSGFPTNLSSLYLGSSGTLTGNLYQLPLPIKIFDLNCNMNLTYTSGRTWYTPFYRLSLTPRNPTSSWSGFSKSETDGLLIDTKPPIYQSNPVNVFAIRCLIPSDPRTSTSDDAYNALVSLIGSPNIKFNR